MNTCSRMNEIHPDATHPELYEPTRPRACKEHIMSEMRNNREGFKVDMDRMKSAKATLDTKIRGIKEITDTSKEEIHEAMDEFQSIMKPIEKLEDNCKPPSLFLPEFDKIFTDEPCPYMREREVKKMPKKEVDIEETSTTTTTLKAGKFEVVVTGGKLINIKTGEGSDRILIETEDIPIFDEIYAKAKKLL